MHDVRAGDLWRYTWNDGAYVIVMPLWQHPEWSHDFWFCAQIMGRDTWGDLEVRVTAAEAWSFESTANWKLVSGAP